MKIDLEYPYNEIYKAGYLRVNRENRNTLYLVKHEGIHTSSSTSYSRYLMAVHLKRFLTEDEQVDHIDNDKSNDIIENLQILSMKENLSKSKRPRAMTTLINLGSYLDKSCHTRENFREKINLLLLKIN